LPLLVLVAWPFSLAAAGLLPIHPRCEYLENPLGIDTLNPRFAWEVSTSERDARQAAFQIQAAMNPSALRAGRDLAWDSGKVATAQSTQPYPCSRKLILE
jgi:alpha-L-rhamnosidase